MLVTLQQIFSQILTMNITATIIILLIILVRIPMKRLPKLYSYLLWIVVLFRLLCPISISSDLSIFSVIEPPVIATSPAEDFVTYHQEQDISHTTSEVTDTDLSMTIEESIVPSRNPVKLFSAIWIFGCIIMICYAVISYCRLQYRLQSAVYIRDNIFIVDHIPTPFVAGIIRPRIYLVSDLSEKEQKLIILHEQQHIRRRDYIIKIIAYFALCIHWFNPFVWIAFTLSANDMEMSCDEAVLKKMGEELRADYAESLLRFSSCKNFRFATPLAFGEGNTKKRIKNLAKWKKPALVTIIFAGILCIIMIWITISNPKDSENSLRVRMTTVETEATLTPVCFPDDAMIDEEQIPVYTVNNSAVLYFDPGWDTDMLTITEEYHPDPNNTNTMQTKTYKLINEDHGEFYLPINTRNNNELTYTLYSICSDTRTYMIKIIFTTADEAVILDAHQKTVPTDSSQEWIHHSYYKMSDGTWQAEIEDQASNTTQMYTYRYRIVMHGRMPNAETESNFIVLSNSKDLTFDQIWKASGISSLMDDYFSYEDAVIVSSWTGDLTSNHPVKDADTIYLIGTDRNLGIQFEASDVTDSGLTLTCTQADGEPSGELQTGSYFLVELLIPDIGCVPATCIIDEVAWTEESWIIPMNDSISWDINWEWLYGKLPAGIYRIGKEVIDFRGTDDYDKTILYAEFEIKE